MAEVLKTIDLKKTYQAKGIKTYALNGIDLDIEEGEFLGIMGPSGSGKTTLLNLISTIDLPTSGQVLFKGTDLKKLKGKKLAQFRRDHIGFLFQDFNLLNNLNVMDNIALPLALSGEKSDVIKRKIEDLTTFFGLSKHIEKYPYQLSGGQKQRVAAARALITNPSVILADEPTGALDSKSAAELLGSLRDMNEKYKSTIVMVTHDPLSASYCSRIVFIKDGKIYGKLNKEGTKKDFYKKILDLLPSIGGANHEFSSPSV